VKIAKSRRVVESPLVCMDLKRRPQISAASVTPLYSGNEIAVTVKNTIKEQIRYMLYSGASSRIERYCMVAVNYSIVPN
jgi:hypothetical protein